MPEGHVHRQLVQHLVTAITTRYPIDRVVYNDGDRFSFGSAAPPLIGDTRPDIYLLQETSKHVVIGEAKSATDIDNEHTERQLANYFGHLSTSQSGELWIAVPYVCAGAAHRLCAATRRKVHLDHIPFEIIGWLLGPRPFSQVWRA